ncbi:MAG: Uma2 family endonuclease [Vulcanimicrobiaceae bacterium]
MSVHPQPLTPSEFLAWEERQTTKHEFRAGAVCAMAGASDDHNQIVTNLVSIVRPALRGGPGRVYASDMLLATDNRGTRYPDLLVTCDRRDAEQRRVKRYRKLLVEVLSESTAGVDAGDKLEEYQTIAELEEYVLVDSRKVSVRLYRRNGEKLETDPPIISGAIELASLRLAVPIADLYEDVAWSVRSATVRF